MTLTFLLRKLKNEFIFILDLFNRNRFRFIFLIVFNRVDLKCNELFSRDHRKIENEVKSDVMRM